MREIVAEGTVDASVRGRNVTLNALQQPASAIPDRIQEALRTRAFEASRSTLDRLVGEVMDNLAQAAEEGLGVRDAATRLGESFEGMKEFELRRIARTEINRAQQDASMNTEQELGVEFHQWITAEDERVRFTHDIQHEEIVRVGDFFSNGLVRPGDSSGPPEEFINCRCRLAPFIIPHGMRAPVDQATFYESDLVEVAA